MKPETPEEIVRACYAAYEQKDRSIIEPLLASGFTFSSPIDDCISRKVYFERCWPNSEHADKFDIETLVTVGNKVIAQYKAKSKDGATFRNTEIFELRDGQVVHVDVYFGLETAESATEEEIRSVIDARNAAITRKDKDAVVASYTPDPVRFDLAPPLVSDPTDTEGLQAWFDTWDGEIGYEIRDVIIESKGDLACTHSLNHMTGTKKDGEQVNVWFRETLTLKKPEGRWLISHEHESVPFYMDGSDKAALDLKP